MLEGMNTDPDFFLTIYEPGGDLARVWACHVVRRVKGPHHDQYAWVSIEPPLDGRPLGVGGELDHLLLSPRHEGGSLFPLSAFPIHAYVALPKNDSLLENPELGRDDVQLIAWAVLHENEADAAMGRDT